MRMKNWLFLLVGALLPGWSMAQPTDYGADQSGTKATVVLKDGSTRELDEFALYGSERYPRAYYPGTRSAQGQEFAVKADAFWRVIPPVMLKSLDRVPDHDPKVDSWATFEVVLTSGDHYRAHLPLRCKVTWLACDGFQFGGRTSVLGVIGDFAIEVKDLKSITLYGERASAISPPSYFSNHSASHPIQRR